MSNISWLFELKRKVPNFLQNLKGSRPGFFHYSLSGDLIDEKINWGLGNAVFATKIYYTLNLLQDLPSQEKQGLADFIQSFQKENGFFFDSQIQKKSRVINMASSLKNWDLNNFWGSQTKVAETRQSISALKLLNTEPKMAFSHFPQTKECIANHLKKLDWTKPWGAGSHFSHLLFFLANSQLANKDSLIDFAIRWINKLQNSKNGSWHLGNPSQQQKINGAMKIITGLKAAGQADFKYPEKLIDLCLEAQNDSHACDNFNVAYVLKYANSLLQNSYRNEEIQRFCYNRLEIYKKYYYPKIGGFSFKENQANDSYYGAKITRGLNEPDIHGTVMFLWGISIIAQVLEINNQLEFKEFLT